MVPRPLVVNDGSPSLQTDAHEHKEIENSQEVDIYRANALVFTWFGVKTYLMIDIFMDYARVGEDVPRGPLGD